MSKARGPLATGCGNRIPTGQGTWPCFRKAHWAARRGNRACTGQVPWPCNPPLPTLVI